MAACVWICTALQQRRRTQTMPPNHSAFPISSALPCIANVRPQGRSARRVAGRRRLVVAAAMFDNLSTSLQNTFKSISPDGRLSPENMKEPLREIRRCVFGGSRV